MWWRAYQVFKKCNVFFTSNTFVSKARLILAKNQTKAKKNAEAEPWLYENYLLS